MAWVKELLSSFELLHVQILAKIVRMWVCVQCATVLCHWCNRALSGRCHGCLSTCVEAVRQRALEGGLPHVTCLIELGVLVKVVLSLDVFERCVDQIEAFEFPRPLLLFTSPGQVLSIPKGGRGSDLDFTQLLCGRKMANEAWTLYSGGKGAA